MRKEEPITYKYERENTNDVRTVESHPAFGQARFARKQGNPGKLYGSNLDRHECFITLEIHRSELIHDLNHDWYFPCDSVVDIDFSAAQFAELLTTMNVGGGVPCTLRYIHGEAIPAIPQEVQTESERIEESFKRALSAKVEQLAEFEKEVAEILEKQSIGKKDRVRIKNLMYQARRFFTDAAPFAVSSLYEAKEKVVTSAKAEIEAFMTNAIVRAGILQLKGKSYEEFSNDSAINDTDLLPKSTKS